MRHCLAEVLRWLADQLEPRAYTERKALLIERLSAVLLCLGAGAEESN